MAQTEAIQVMQAIYEHVDRHVRELLPPSPAAEVDSINVLVGDGVTVLTAGVAACIRVDFRSRITGSFVQEFDGTSGSVVLGIARAAPGSSPSFVSIVASAPPTISSGRYGADETLVGWTTSIDRGDLLRFSVTSATSIKRVLVALRIRRLEP
jgi:hypothetical protein